MRDTTRVILIVLGTLLLVLVFSPLLFMGGMMGAMMGGGGMTWATGILALVVLLAAVALLTLGIRQRP
jgi:hypothetical protein